MLKDKDISYKLITYMIVHSKFIGDSSIFYMKDLNRKDFSFRNKQGKSETIILSQPTLNKYLKKMREDKKYGTMFQYNEEDDSFTFFLDKDSSSNFIVFMSNKSFYDLYYEYDELMWRVYLYLYRKNYEFRKEFKTSIGRLIKELGYSNSTQNRDTCRTTLNILKNGGTIDFFEVIDQGNESNHLIERIQVTKVEVNG